MHLVYHSMEKKPLPATMPADLVPPSHRSRVPVGGVPVLPVMPTLNTGSSQASVDTTASFPALGRSHICSLAPQAYNFHYVVINQCFADCL